MKISLAITLTLLLSSTALASSANHCLSEVHSQLTPEGQRRLSAITGEDPVSYDEVPTSGRMLQAATKKGSASPQTPEDPNCVAYEARIERKYCVKFDRDQNRELSCTKWSPVYGEKKCSKWTTVKGAKVTSVNPEHAKHKKLLSEKKAELAVLEGKARSVIETIETTETNNSSEVTEHKKTLVKTLEAEVKKISKKIKSINVEQIKAKYAKALADQIQASIKETAALIKKTTAKYTEIIKKLEDQSKSAGARQFGASKNSKDLKSEIKDINAQRNKHFGSDKAKKATELKEALNKKCEAQKKKDLNKLEDGYEVKVAKAKGDFNNEWNKQTKTAQTNHRNAKVAKAKSDYAAWAKDYSRRVDADKKSFMAKCKSAKDKACKKRGSSVSVLTRRQNTEISQIKSVAYTFLKNPCLQKTTSYLDPKMNAFFSGENTNMYIRNRGYTYPVHHKMLDSQRRSRRSDWAKIQRRYGGENGTYGGRPMFEAKQYNMVAKMRALDVQYEREYIGYENGYLKKAQQCANTFRNKKGFVRYSYRPHAGASWACKNKFSRAINQIRDKELAYAKDLSRKYYEEQKRELNRLWKKYAKRTWSWLLMKKKYRGKYWKDWIKILKNVSKRAYEAHKAAIRDRNANRLRVATAFCNTNTFYKTDVETSRKKILKRYSTLIKTSKKYNAQCNKSCSYRKPSKFATEKKNKLKEYENSLKVKVDPSVKPSSSWQKKHNQARDAKLKSLKDTYNADKKKLNGKKCSASDGDIKSDLDAWGAKWVKENNGSYEKKKTAAKNKHNSKFSASLSKQKKSIAKEIARYRKIMAEEIKSAHEALAETKKRLEKESKAAFEAYLIKIENVYKKKKKETIEKVRKTITEEWSKKLEKLTKTHATFIEKKEAIKKTIAKAIEALKREISSLENKKVSKTIETAGKDTKHCSQWSSEYTKDNTKFKCIKRRTSKVTTTTTKTVTVCTNKDSKDGKMVCKKTEKVTPVTKCVEWQANNTTKEIDCKKLEIVYPKKGCQEYKTDKNGKKYCAVTIIHKPTFQCEKYMVVSGTRYCREEKTFFGQKYHVFICTKTGKVLWKEPIGGSSSSENPFAASKSSKKPLPCKQCMSYQDMATNALAGLGLEDIMPTTSRILIEDHTVRVKQQMNEFDNRDRRILNKCL